MKVLHLGKYAPPFFGGIENFMMDLGHGCVEQGLEVAAIVHHHDSKGAFEQCVIDGVSVYRVPCYGQLMFAPVSPTFGFHLNQVLETFKPDVLHIHMPNTSAFFALWSSKAKLIPWVVHWHSDVLGDDSPWFLKTFYPFYQPFEQAILQRATKVIVTSPPYLQSSRALQRFVAKCEVISLGIRTPVVPAYLDHNTEEQRAGLQLLMVGRLTYYKGHMLLLEALSLLKQQGLCDIHLTIVGCGELQQAIEIKIAGLRLDTQVTMLGKVDDDILAQAFINADCLCLPSLERTEAFGVVLMEAASFGKPAIVSDVPGSGMSWVVQDNKTGFVVKRGNADALAMAIKSLYQQPKKLQQFGGNAKQRFEQLFQIDKVCRTTIDLYQALVQSTTPQ